MASPAASELYLVGQLGCAGGSVDVLNVSLLLCRADAADVGSNPGLCNSQPQH